MKEIWQHKVDMRSITLHWNQKVKMINIMLNMLIDFLMCVSQGKGGKNRRRGKNENESEKRELVFKEDGQGEY